MARMSITTVGFIDFANWLTQKGVAVASVDSDELDAGARILLAKMKQNATKHHKTGTLQKALKISWLSKHGTPEVRVGVVNGVDAPHAHLVEYGHGGPHPAPPHPFMREAVDACEDEVMDAVMQSIADGLGL